MCLWQPGPVYSGMLQAVVEAGQYERAVEMLDNIYLHAERGGITGKCLEVVVRAHLQQGELEDALDTLSIFTLRPSVETFMLMVRFASSSPASCSLFFSAVCGAAQAAISAHVVVHWTSKRV